MSKKNTIGQTRENNAETATWILDLKTESKQTVKDFILENGMKSFLLNHESLNLTETDQVKIDTLKRVLQKYNGDIETVDFGDIE